jgi:NTE family protein
MPKKLVRVKRDGMPKVGIALSAGAVRGMSQIGILKVLEREGIPISCIAGTSIGAVIGALYASGIKAEKLEEIAKTTELRSLIDFTTPKTGLIAGKIIESYIRDMLKDKCFEDLDIPLSVIATELNSGETVIFNHGELAKAVRASISIPGIFEPVAYGDYVLVDGGLVDPAPVDVVKEMGADIIIAVDLTEGIKKPLHTGVKKERSDFIGFFKKSLVAAQLGYFKEFLEDKNIKMPFFIMGLLNPKKVLKMIMSNEMPKILEYQVTSFELLIDQLAKEKLKYSYINLIIKPQLEGIRWEEFDKTHLAIEAGEKAAEKLIPRIRELIKEKQH